MESISIKKKEILFVVKRLGINQASLKQKIGECVSLRVFVLYFIPDTVNSLPQIGELRKTAIKIK